MKMKAALMYGPNDIRVEETDKPTCPEDGLILKINHNTLTNRIHHNVRSTKK